MIRSYLKIAIRSLLRNKGFTCTNMLGLILGISFSTMLYTYVKHELSYDSFHSKSERMFRILTVDKSISDNPLTYAVTVPPLGPALVNTFPEVESMTRLYRFSGQVIVDVNGEKFNERNWFTTSDSNFFLVFDFDLISGDRATALAEPFSLVLTESMAAKYFGDGNALGKTITLLGYGEVKVTGIMKDIPSNSHLRFDLLFSNLRTGAQWEAQLNDWEEFGAATYIVLESGNGVANLQKRLPVFMRQHWGETADKRAVAFQAVEDIYLHSDHIKASAEQPRGNVSYVYIFSSMAIFLLLIAAINYVNLTTSKAASRAKEIGVRKVAGAFKTQLVIQFLTEAFIITLAAMLISVAVINLAFPYFNTITGKNFELTLDTIGQFMPSLLIITALIGLLAGGYPAFYLSKLKPVSMLKGELIASGNGIQLRSVLVVFQFVITIVLIVSTLVIGNQIHFIQTKNIGFDKNHMMIIDINSGDVRRQFQAMKNEFSKVNGVKQVAVSSRVPGEWKNIREVHIRSQAHAESVLPDSLKSYFMGFDEDMLDTYGLTLVAGTFFSGDNKADSMNVLINATAAKTMNLKDPVGSVLHINTERGPWRVNVIGVLNDFNFQSLHQEIAPIVIGFRNNPVHSIDYFSLKVSGALEPLIAAVTEVHEKFDIHTPIEYHFLNEQIDTFYVAEKKAGMIFRMAGSLSVIVACLGLLGLANYHLQKKKKELGIRKILGAGQLNLFLLVSLTFTKQVAVAFVIACPLAWYMMRQWLTAFEYRIPLNAGVFVISGLLVLFLVVATVSYHALKATRFNPIDSLRTE